ncbi:MAG: PilZ domain-containing protein [Polyangiales bacterium]
MNSNKRRPSKRPPPIPRSSEVRPAAAKDERRRADRWDSDAEVDILSPIQQVASAVDVSKTGMQLSLDHWLAAGTVCDLRITTHTGGTLLKRARVIWTRREGKRCVSGLEVMGSIAPHASGEE